MSSRRTAEARSRAARLRRTAAVYLFLAALWALLAVAAWFNRASSKGFAVVYTVLAAVQVVLYVVWGRKRKFASPYPEPGIGVELLDVDEAVLDRLVGAALAGAEPDEVTPPLAGPRWGPERIEWLRRLHRDRRPGLDGPLGEATWAVAVDGEIVGGARLKRTAEPDVLETGIWLTRSARGRGVGRNSIADVLEKARDHGARAVRADTSPGNAAALYVLQRLGFRTWVEGDRVNAVRELV